MFIRVKNSLSDQAQRLGCPFVTFLGLTRKVATLHKPHYGAKTKIIVLEPDEEIDRLSGIISGDSVRTAFKLTIT